MTSNIKENQINVMFNIAEKTIMEVICDYMGMPPNKIFKDCIVLDLAKDDLILLPQRDDNKYHCFGLEIVPYYYSFSVPDSLKNNKAITESIEFLIYSVTEVYNAIIQYNLLDENKDIAFEKSIHFEFDPETNTFFPQYIFPNRRQIQLYTHFKNKLEEMKEVNEYGHSYWDTLNEEARDRWFDEYYNFVNLINNTPLDEKTAEEKEKTINDELEYNNRIGIVYKELLFEQLPDVYKQKIIKLNKLKPE